MDLQLALVSSLLKGGPKSIIQARKAGISSELLTGEAKDLFKFIEEFNNSYEMMPSIPVIIGRTGIKPIEVSEPVDYYIAEYKNLRLFNTLQEELSTCVSYQEARKPHKTIETMEKAILKIRESYYNTSNVQELYEVGQEALDLYEQIASGHKGILTPWESLNNISYGFWPEDVIIFAARSGVGKTFTTLLLLEHVVEQQGKRALVVSPEMPKERLALRYNSIHLKIPYWMFTHGQLDPDSKKLFKDQIERTKAKKGIGIIASQSFDYSVASLSTAVAEYKPDVLFIDGVYLLKSNGVNRNDQAANLMMDIKRLAIRHRIPIIITTQFNRDVSTEKSKTVQDKGIAMTDVAAWNASMAFGLTRDNDLKNQKMMVIKPLKTREGVAEDIKVYWDFHTMNFSEVDSKQNSGSSGTNIVIDRDDPFAVKTHKIDKYATKLEDDEELPF